MSGSSIVVNHLTEACSAIVVKIQILQICFMMIQTGLHIVEKAPKLQVSVITVSYLVLLCVMYF